MREPRGCWSPYGPPAPQGDGGGGRGAGGVMETEARIRGGARPRAGRNLDGRMHLVGGLELAPLWSPRCDGGT